MHPLNAQHFDSPDLADFVWRSSVLGGEVMDTVWYAHNCYKIVIKCANYQHCFRNWTSSEMFLVETRALAFQVL